VAAPLVAIVGPTASGKSALAMRLARERSGEIVSCDSLQVYRGLDIGSAKPTAAQRARVPHHVVDVVDPDEGFDCARFRRLASAAIADMTARGKRVLVVGGTGLYVKALLRGLFEGPARDARVRARLAALEEATPGSLHARLTVVDPAAAARLHPHDRVRLIRALEVHELTGQPISAWQARHAFADRTVDALVLGLSVPRVELYARIDARCAAMVRDGLVDEVRQLYARGLDPDLPALRSPGYREIGEHVRGLCDLPDAIARMAHATRRLAKRQLTWFRGDPRVVWCAPEVAALQRDAHAFWAL
jgi:tRNA dimethylallyltransferase